MLSPFFYHGIEDGPRLIQTQTLVLQNTHQESDIPQKRDPPKNQRPLGGKERLVLFLRNGGALEVAIPIEVAFSLLALIASIIIATALLRLTLLVEFPTAKRTKKVLAPSVAGSRQKRNAAMPAPSQHKPSS